MSEPSQPGPPPVRAEVLAFLADIKEHPEDDTPRLILADWLEENGSPGDAARAEFIRTQLRKARLPVGDPEHYPLGRREQELQQRWGAAWLGPLHQRARSLRHERGLVTLSVDTGVLCSRNMLALQGTESWAWVQGGKVESAVPSDGARLASCPLLADWNTLSLSSSSAGRTLGTVGVSALVRSAHLGRLTRLELVANDIDAGGARALASASSLRRLTELDLTANHIGDDGVRALAGSPVLHSLLRLELARNTIGNAGAAALAASVTLSRLQELHLGDNNLTDDAARALADSHSLAGLTRLVLWGNAIGPAGVDRLVARFGPRVFVSRSALSQRS